MDEDRTDPARNGVGSVKPWFFLAPLLLAAPLVVLPITFNHMASEPIGFYWMTHHPAPFAQVCLPSETEAQAIRLGVPPNPGTCPGGHEPLLKQLFVASDRHPIFFSAAGFTVDGRLLPNTAPVARTVNGKLLEHIPYGTYTRGLFAISTHHPRSYDSRYFGPVNPKSVARFARPLLVMD